MGCCIKRKEEKESVHKKEDYDSNCSRSNILSVGKKEVQFHSPRPLMKTQQLGHTLLMKSKKSEPKEEAITD